MDSGKIVIDKLKLCYKRDNESRFWQMMAEQPEHIQVGDFDLVRGQTDGDEHCNAQRVSRCGGI